MKAQPSAKNLIKILIGAAWIDGEIQPEERKHLYQVAKKEGIADDPELQRLLDSSRPISSTECRTWVKEYLGNRPTPEDCNQLLEAISGLIYSDSDIADEEAELLTQLQQSSDPTNREPGQFYTSAVKGVQNLYRRWMSS
jgi:hypothetical protein